MPSPSQPTTQPRDYGLVNAVWSALVGGLLATAKAHDRDAPPVAELPCSGSRRSP